MAEPKPLRLRADQAEKLIHQRAEDSGNVILTLHAKERMEERGILRRDLDRILLTGYVTEPPMVNESGHWQCKIVRRITGSREAGAVTVLSTGDKLVVRTVEWEDIR